MQITIGDIGAIAGSLIYRPAFSGHRYRMPHIIAIGYLVFAIGMASYLWINMSRENERRNKLAGQDGKEDGINEIGGAQDNVYLGDRDVRYRYQL